MDIKGKIGVAAGIVLIVFLIAGGATWYLKDIPPNDSSTEGTSTNQGDEGEKKTDTTQVSPPPSTTVSAKKLRLVTPNGGEIWERGKQYSVRWVSELPSNVRAKVSVFKTNSVVSDPYAGSGVAGRDMFSPSLFPAGTNEGLSRYSSPLHEDGPSRGTQGIQFGNPSLDYRVGRIDLRSPLYKSNAIWFGVSMVPCFIMFETASTADVVDSPVGPTVFVFGIGKDIRFPF